MLAVGSVEHQSAFSEGIQVGRDRVGIAVGSDGTIQIIGDDQKHVGGVFTDDWADQHQRECEHAKQFGWFGGVIKNELL